MQHILRLDASARTSDSNSRALGDYVEQQWHARQPDGRITRRDLAREPIEQIRQETIAGFYTPPEALTPELRAATALSDQLIGELQAADTLLITTPMYNFGVPAALKAWIDQIVRIGHTFSYDGSNFGGLVKADTAIICAAYGASGYEAGGGFRAANFVEPYLAFLLGFLGVKQVHFISVQATTADADTVAAGLASARADADRLLSQLVV